VYYFHYSEANGDVVGPENFRLLAACLNGNTKLTSLGLNRLGGTAEWSASCNDCFCKLLCNTTSIENICNSNHTLQEIGGYQRSRLLNEYLELNKNENKSQVIRNKILKYYFVGDFDIPTIFKGVGFFNALCRNPVDAGTFPKALKKPTPFGRFLCNLAFAVGKPLGTLVSSCVIFTRDKRR
jgi:hypothetical protein